MLNNFRFKDYLKVHIKNEGTKKNPFPKSISFSYYIHNLINSFSHIYYNLIKRVLPVCVCVYLLLFSSAVLALYIKTRNIYTYKIDGIQLAPFSVRNSRQAKVIKSLLRSPIPNIAYMEVVRGFFFVFTQKTTHTHTQSLLNVLSPATSCILKETNQR